jgi:hypothetical protein
MRLTMWHYIVVICLLRNSFRLVKLWESGLTYFWGNIAIGKNKATECFQKKRQKSSAQQVPIRLTDLTSAFLILGIGLGLAIIAFVHELIKSKIHSRTKLSMI